MIILVSGYVSQQIKLIKAAKSRNRPLFIHKLDSAQVSKQHLGQYREWWRLFFKNSKREQERKNQKGENKTGTIRGRK